MKELIFNMAKWLERNRRINKLVADDDDWDFGGACGYGSPRDNDPIVACGYTQSFIDNGC